MRKVKLSGLSDMFIIKQHINSKGLLVTNYNNPDCSKWEGMLINQPFSKEISSENKVEKEIANYLVGKVASLSILNDITDNIMNII